MADQQVKVVTAQAGQYTLDLPQSGVARVDVVDVDIVLETKSGLHVVLAGAAIEAAGEHPPQVKFSDGVVGVAELFQRVDKIETPDTAIPVLSSLEEKGGDKTKDEDKHKGDGKKDDDTGQDGQQDDKTDQNTDESSVDAAAVAPLSMPAQSSAEKLLEDASKKMDEASTKTGNFDMPPNPLEAPPSAASAPAASSPESYPVNPSLELWFGNVVGVTDSGSSVTGSGGATGTAATDSISLSDALQIAAETIVGGDGDKVIYADGAFAGYGTNASTGMGYFAKEVYVKVDGTFTSLSALTISGLQGTGISIAGATLNSAGAYTLAAPSSGTGWVFELVYPLGETIGPVTLTLTETVVRSSVSGSSLQTVDLVYNMVVEEMDVTSASDLSGSNSKTYILPEYGVANYIEAGTGNETIYGGQAGDTFDGAGESASSKYTMYGGHGSDTFLAGVGAEYFDGNDSGSGTNVVSYQDSGTAGLVIDVSNTTLGGGSLATGAASGDVYVDIQKVIGTSGDDTFIGGTSGAVTLDGGAGNNWIDYEHAGSAVTLDLSGQTANGGAASSDVFVNVENVIGSAYGDLLTGNSNSAGNSLLGLGGDDTLIGGSSGHDYLDGGTGDDTLTGGAGGSNTLLGGAGDDTLISGAGGHDTLDGGAGTNVASFAGSSVGLVIDPTSGGHGTGAAASDVFNNIQVFVGTAYDDTFIGGTAGSGLTTMEGNGGNDWVSYAYASGGATVDLADQTGNAGAALYDRYQNIENVIGANTGSNLLIGDTSANTLVGGSGAGVVNTLEGSGGGDNLVGGSGAVNIASFANVTTTGLVIDLTGASSGGSTFYSGALATGAAAGNVYVNISSVVGSANADTFIGGTASGSPTLVGGTGDWIDYSSITEQGVTLNLANNSQNGAAARYDRLTGIENVKGANSAFGNLLIGDDNVNSLVGGSGVGVTNTLVGGGGGDDLVGGVGAVNIVSYYTSATTGMVIDVNNTVLGGGSLATGDAAGDVYDNIQTVIGSHGDDTFIGATSGSMTLDGGLGNNWIDYEHASTGVTLDLSGVVAAGGAAVSDHLVRIENIIGSNNGDTLYGDSSGNSIVVGTGSDLVFGADGNDWISVRGGTGVNTLSGDAGSDTVYGGAGTDWLYGGTGNDTLVAGTGHETLFGGTGTNLLVGGGSADAVADYHDSDLGTAFSGTLNLTVNLTSGTATGTNASGGVVISDSLSGIENVVGGPGTDLLIGDSLANTLLGEGVKDTLEGMGGDDVLTYAGSGTATLYGGSGSDTLTGSASGTTVLDGGAGADTLDGSAGGVNIASYADAPATGVIIDLATGAYSGSGSGLTITSGLYATSTYDSYQDVYIGVSSVTGSSGADTFIGGTPSDSPTMVGGSGDVIDYEHATSGVAVTLNGSSLATVGGAAANDKFYGIENIRGSNNGDTLIGDSQANTIIGGTGSDTIGGAGGGDRLDGGSGGVNTLYYAASGSTGVTVLLGGTDQNGSAVLGSPATGYTGVGKLGSLAVDSFTNFQDVSVSGGSDLVVGDASANAITASGATATLYGMGGNDVLTYAGSGTATLYGGSGSDTLTGSASGTTVLDGGAGADTLIGQSGGTAIASYADAAGSLTIDLTGAGSGGGTFYSGSHAATGSDSAGDVYIDIASVVGSTHADTFIGGTASGSPTMVGGGGADWIDYKEGNIAFPVTVDLAAGTAVGAFGTDHLSGIENVWGSDNGDTLIGDSLANSIIGGAGNDTIEGGGGGDYLNGGGGTNTADYSFRGGSVTVDLISGRATYDSSTDTLVNIQNATGGAGDDLFYASNSGTNNTFAGGGGFDTVSYQHASAGLATGFTIDPTGGGYGTKVDVYSGISDIVGSVYADTFIGASSSTITLTGGGGADWIDFTHSLTGVTVDLSSGTAGSEHLVNIENIIGSDNGDSLTGDSLANTILGGAANDVIDGLGGGDYLDGGGVSPGGANTVSYAGVSGNVTVNLGSHYGSVTGSAATDTLYNFEDIIGSSNSNLLIGDSLSNTIWGNGTNDTLMGAGGADLLVYQGSGTGILDGGAGADTLWGKSGVAIASYADATAGLTIDLTGAATTLAAGTTDLVSGSYASGGDAGGDIYVNIGSVVGSAYADTFIGGTQWSGAPTMVGGAGDVIDYEHAASSVTVALHGTSLATVGGAAASDKYYGIENIIGSNHGDTLTGDSSANTIVGGSGNDLIAGGGGGDSLNGGAGTNTLDYSFTSSSVTVNLDSGRAYYGGYTDTLANFLNVRGGTGNDTITGSTSGNTIWGGGGTDTLYGDGGGDTFIGAEGTQYMSDVSGTNYVDYEYASAALTVNLSSGVNGGAAANDHVGSGIENIIGSNGYGDTLTGDTAANIFVIAHTAGVASGLGDTIDGGAGVDTVDYSRNSSGVTVDLASFASLTGSVSASLLSDFGLGTSDWLTGYGIGKAGAAGDFYKNIEVAKGGSGNDVLIAGAGATLLGAGGNDTLVGFGGNDYFDGGSGSNIVTFAYSTQGMVIDATSASVGGGHGTNDAAGDYFVNVASIVGSSHGDTFIGGNASGSPTMVGGSGNNWIDYEYASSGALVNLATHSLDAGSAAHDSFTGIENIIGSSSGDTLYGDSSNNSILGGGGTDTIFGSSGTDYLDGGTLANADILNFSNISTGISIVLNGSSAGSATGSGISDTLYNFEVLYGGSGADSIVANGLGVPYTIYAGAGNDTVSVSLSDLATVYLDGGAGTNTLTGGGGTNYFMGAASGATDVLYGQGTLDIFHIQSLSGVDTIHGNASGVEILDLSNTFGLGLTAGSVTIALGNVSSSSPGTGTLVSGTLTDTLFNIDVVYGNNSGDVVTVSPDSPATIFGGSGADLFYGATGSGYDSFSGGGGNDTVSYADITGNIVIDPTNTTLGTGGYGTHKDTYSSIETIVGSVGSDTFIGGASAVTLVGNAGYQNWIDYSHSSSSVIVNLGTHSGAGAGEYLSNIENITGSSHNDSLTGDASANSIKAGAGNDTIFYSAGGDYIDGGSGTDTMNYSTATGAVTVYLSNTDLSGNTGVYALPTSFTGGDSAGDYFVNVENLTGSSDGDLLVGDSNANTILGGAGNDTIYGGGGGDSLDGGTGVNTLNYLSEAAAVTIDLANGTVVGGTGTDHITDFQIVYGSKFSDLIIGDGNSDTFYGGLGNDTLIAGSAGSYLDGGAGTNTLEGGTGNDTFIGGTGSSDILIGNGGTDTVDYSVSAALGVTFDLDAGTASNTSFTDTLDGISIIKGSVNDDVFDATGSGFSATTLYGGAGNDRFDLSATALAQVAKIDGGSGSDELISAGGTFSVSQLSGIESIDVSTSTDTATYSFSLTASDIETITGNSSSADLTLRLDSGETFTASTSDLATVTSSGTASDMTYTYVDTSSHTALLHVITGP